MRCCTWSALNPFLRCPLETPCSGCLTCRDFMSPQLPETWASLAPHDEGRDPWPHSAGTDWRRQELSEASQLENSISLLFFSLVQNPRFVCSRLYAPREIHGKTITYSSVMSRKLKSASNPARCLESVVHKALCQKLLENTKETSCRFWRGEDTAQDTPTTTYKMVCSK